LISLIDDNSIAARAYALRILMHIGPMSYEQLKTLATPLLARLDDLGSEIREKAAKCLGKLQLKLGEDEDMWNELLKQILSPMFIHLESLEISLNAALLESLRNLAARNPTIYQASRDAATICDEMKRQLP